MIVSFTSSSIPTSPFKSADYYTSHPLTLNNAQLEHATTCNKTNNVFVETASPLSLKDSDGTK